MDAALYSAALDKVPPQRFDELPPQTYHTDSALQALQLLDALADQSLNLAKWRSIAVDGRVVPSYVLIGPRAGRIPIRLALVGGIRPSDLLSTISIAKILVDLDLASFIAQDFALFAYPLANPSRLCRANLTLTQVSGRMRPIRWCAFLSGNLSWMN